MKKRIPRLITILATIAITFLTGFVVKYFHLSPELAQLFSGEIVDLIVAAAATAGLFLKLQDNQQRVDAVKAERDKVAAAIRPRRPSRVALPEDNRG